MKFLGLLSTGWSCIRVCGLGSSVRGSPSRDFSCLWTRQKAGPEITRSEWALPTSVRTCLNILSTRASDNWALEVLQALCPHCRPSLLPQSDSRTSRRMTPGGAERQNRSAFLLCWSLLLMPSFCVPTSTSCPAQLALLQDSVQRSFLKIFYKHFKKYRLLENAHSPKLRKTGWKTAPVFEIVIPWADLMLQQDSDMRSFLWC